MIRPTIDYHGIGGGKAVENGGGIIGDLGGGEAETGSEHGIYLKVCGRAGDGVVYTVLRVDDAGNLLNGRLNAWAELIEQLRVAGEELDNDVFGLVGQVADHVLKHLYEHDVEGGLGFEDAGTDVGHHLVDVAVAFGFEPDREVSAVGLGDCGEAHLEASTA
jgi:hypothetical protein